MSMNENKKEDQKPQPEVKQDQKKPEDSGKKPEYKGNNPGGAASKQS